VQVRYALILACRLPGLIALALPLVVPGNGVAQPATDPTPARCAVGRTHSVPASGSHIPRNLPTKPDRRLKLARSARS